MIRGWSAFARNRLSDLERFRLVLAAETRGDDSEVRALKRASGIAYAMQNRLAQSAQNCWALLGLEPAHGLETALGGSVGGVR